MGTNPDSTLHWKELDGVPANVRCPAAVGLANRLTTGTPSQSTAGDTFTVEHHAAGKIRVSIDGAALSWSIPLKFNCNAKFYVGREGTIWSTKWDGIWWTRNGRRSVEIQWDGIWWTRNGRRSVEIRRHLVDQEEID